MLTTRFTTETYSENKRYCENNSIKCIYNGSLPISDKLPYQDYYILEMNNTTNKIMGIGQISKKLQPTVQIYTYRYYNRYTYKGIKYASLENENIENLNITDEEKTKIKILIKEIEKKIFYGKGHIKRGSSITSFPLFPHKQYIPQLISIFNNICIS